MLCIQSAGVVANLLISCEKRLIDSTGEEAGRVTLYQTKSIHPMYKLGLQSYYSPILLPALNSAGVQSFAEYLQQTKT